MEKISFIKTKNLVYYYPEKKEAALQDINLSIEEGEFVLIVGGSGCGKSTLVRAMAGIIPNFYGGKFGGQVNIAGENIRDISKKELPQKVGMVFQNPESQLVMINVEQELAFGMENINLPDYLMKRRVMEVAGALNLGNHLHSNIPELSGGLKQKVALASVLAMQPDILVLDEPTSQLDPVAGEEILTIIRRLNEENGITVILIEQRLERCFHLADRFIVMDGGKIILNTTSLEEIAQWAVDNDSPFIPPLSKLFALGNFPQIPVTVKEGRKILRKFYPKDATPLKKENNYLKKEVEKPIVNIKNLWYSYESGTEALKDINFNIYPGQFIALMGENAAGKTTLLKNINGLLKPSRGRVNIFTENTKNLEVEELAGKVGYLSQNPNDYLFLKTVKEELLFTLENLGKKDNGQVESLLKELDIYKYKDTNPRDLSSGERQRVALATVLIAEPNLLLLDEPTRGLDYNLKEELGKFLQDLQEEGKSILMVTHDVEFAAEYAQDILLMSQGRIVSYGDKYSALTRSTFYSPQISKLFNKINDNVLTLADGIKALKLLEV